MTKRFVLAALLLGAASVGCNPSNESKIREGYESSAPASQDKMPAGAEGGSGNVETPPPPPPPQ